MTAGLLRRRLVGEVAVGEEGVEFVLAEACGAELLADLFLRQVSRGATPSFLSRTKRLGIRTQQEHPISCGIGYQKTYGVRILTRLT